MNYQLQILSDPKQAEKNYKPIYMNNQDIYEELSKQYTASKDKEKQLQEENIRLRDEVIRLEKTIFSSLIDKAKARENGVSRNERLAELQFKIIHWESRFAESQPKLDQQHDKFAEYESKLIAYESKIAELESKVIRYREKNADLRSEVITYKDKVVKLKSRLVESEKEIGYQTSVITGYEKDLLESQSLACTFQKKIASLEENAVKDSLASDFKEQAITDLKIRIKDLEVLSARREYDFTSFLKEHFARSNPESYENCRRGKNEKRELELPLHAEQRIENHQVDEKIKYEEIPKVVDGSVEDQSVVSDQEKEKRVN